MEFNFSKDVAKSKLYGLANYGKDFDDVGEWQNNNLLFPGRIEVRSGVIIDRVTLGYGQHFLPHGGMGGTSRDFILSQEEYIVQVDGDFKSFNGVKVLNSLVFRTNKNGSKAFIGYNGAGVDPFSFKVEDGFAICCLYGKALDFVGSIGFYAVRISSLTPKQPMMPKFSEIEMPEMPSMPKMPKM